MMGDTNNGSFFDPVKDALQDVISLYSQVQAVKLNNQLTAARVSAEQYNQPSRMQDAQAIAQSTYAAAQNNKWLVVAAVLVGAGALYVIVRK